MWDFDPENRDPMCGILPCQGGFHYVGFDPFKLGSNVWDVTDGGASRSFLEKTAGKPRGFF